MGKRRFMILDMEKKNPLTERVKYIVFHKRKGYNILIVGPTQTGKSTIALTLSLKIYPRFTLENDCAIIGTMDFQEKLTENVKRGCVKLLDEIGVAMDHHLWWSSIQMALSEIFKIHGHQGKVVIATSPQASQINKDVRELFDLVIETNENSMDWKNHVVKAEVYKLQFNQMTGKLYKSYVRGRYGDGSVRVMRTYTFPFPPKTIWNEYKDLSDKRKLARQDQKLKESKVEILKIESKVFSPVPYVEEIMKEPNKFIRDFYGKKYISREKIMNAFPGVGDTRARRIKAMAEEQIDLNAFIQKGNQ